MGPFGGFAFLHADERGFVRGQGSVSRHQSIASGHNMKVDFLTRSGFGLLNTSHQSLMLLPAVEYFRRGQKRLEGLMPRMHVPGTLTKVHQSEFLRVINNLFSRTRTNDQDAHVLMDSFQATLSRVWYLSMTLARDWLRSMPC